MADNEMNSQEGTSSFISLRKVVAFVLLGVVIYLIILWVGNIDDVLGALSSLEWWWVLPTMMSLSLLNYIIRYVKWQYYLRRIDVDLSHTDSFSIFLAGFTLTVTPGKVGEAIKGYFINELDGTPIAKTAPVVISERVTDLLAMVLLAVFSFLIGISTGNELLLIILAGGLVLVGAFLLSNETFYRKILSKVMGLGPLKRYQDSIDLVEDTMVKTLSPKPMFAGTAISVPGWFMECLELWLLLGLLTGAGLPSLSSASLILLAQATFIHAAASSVGAILMFLPGGLGGYEGFAWIAMTTILLIPDATSSAVILLIRFVTLWFSVIVGFIALGIVTHRKRRRSSETS
ncbi:MAG: lysylphosphatidylglycerol synthase transmembrane domain-containing protein [Candidatus Thorarchaeota archaeon]